MQVQFNFNDLAEAHALESIAEEKLNSLHKLLHNAGSVSADAEFKKVAAQQQGKVHCFEVNLMVDGQLYRAEATEESFEAAIDEVRDELDKELRRNKNKRSTLGRKAGRALKRLIRFRQN